MEKPRLLKEEEIDVRVGTASKTKPIASFLLYKDARCDMNILDEWVGPMNWQRSHSRDNANCIVSIWDANKNAWIAKEDTGTESNTEKEKGLASDSFKRACFNWGIGRELYTAPQIWINLTEKEYNGGKPRTEFSVSHVKCDGREISELRIIDKDLNVRYEYKNGTGKSNLPNNKSYSSQSDEAKAAAEFDKCKTRADITLVWNKYPEYHKADSLFYKKCQEKGKEIKD